MKKTVLIATGLMLLSGNAFATKARMAGLGQDAAKGSHYINDTRSVFRNAAHVNSMNNYVVTEWGTNTAGKTANDTGTEGAESAEGGFFRNAGSFAYGLYLGNNIGSDNADRLNNAGSVATNAKGNTNFQHHTNAIDLFFGGDMGLEWGARVHWAKEKDENGTVTTPSNAVFDRTHSALGLGFGVLMGDLGAYANLEIKDESEGAARKSDKWEADTGINIGVDYKFAGWTLFAEYDKNGYEYKTTDTNGAAAGHKWVAETKTFKLGGGRIHEASSTARVHYDVTYSKVTDSDKNTPATGVTNIDVETKTSSLDFTVGFEADANSWLTWRGAVAQQVLMGSSETKNTPAGTPSTNGKKASDDDTTTVSAGFTLNYGKLKVDATFSNRTAANLTLNDVGSFVGVHYWF